MQQIIIKGAISVEVSVEPHESVAPPHTINLGVYNSFYGASGVNLTTDQARELANNLILLAQALDALPG